MRETHGSSQALFERAELAFAADDSVPSMGTSTVTVASLHKIEMRGTGAIVAARDHHFIGMYIVGGGIPADL
jgi:hypothetical protein